MRMKAMSMGLVCQNLDHPAVPDPSAAAPLDHARELGFKSLQSRNPITHGVEVLSGNGIHLRARAIRVVRQREEGPDALQREAERTAMSDEGQPVSMSPGVGSMVAAGPGRRRQQASLLVIADRLDLRPRLTCEVAYGEGQAILCRHYRNPLNL